MADFNTAINLGIKITEALNGIQKVEKQISQLANKAAGITLDIGGKTAAGGVKLATRNVRDYINTLGTLDRKLGGLGGRLKDVAKAFDFGGKTVVGVAGINALAEALSNLPGFLTGGTSGLQSFASTLQGLTSPINSVVEGLQSIGPTGLAAAGGIATATAAFMAFGPGLRKATKEVNDFKKSFQLGTLDVTQDLISEKTLRDALRSATSEQKKLSAGTAEYTTKTEEVVALQKELTGELRRQEIIYKRVNAEQLAIGETVRRNIRASQASREDSGFSDAETARINRRAVEGALRRQGLVEKEAIGPASQLGSLDSDLARIAYQQEQQNKLGEQRTAQKAKQSQQLADQQRLMQALSALDQRGVSALDEKLNVTRRITNELSLQRQKEKNSQLQGQSMRIPTPYTNAAAKGFPYVALPQTKQEAKIAAAERARAEAKVSLERQKSNSLLANGVTSLRLQLELAKQLGAAYEPYLESLRKVNKRQGQVFRGRANRSKREELGSNNLDLLQRVNKLATNRVLKETLLNKTLEIGVAIRKNDFGLVKQLTNEAEELLKVENARIDSAQRLLKFNNKQKGKDRAAQAGKGKKNSRLNENLALGAGFPLLFGAGPGGVAGGVAGALVGGDGFGLQILLSALGTQLDELGAIAIKTAKNLARPSENFKEINESLRLFDRAAEDSIQRAIELGFAEEANAKIRDAVAKRIGANGVQSLDALNEASKQAEIAFAELSLQLQRLIAGPATSFLELVTKTLKESADYYKNIADINNLQERLTPEKRKEFNKEINKNFNENRSRFGIRVGNQEEVAEIIKKFTELPSTKPAETLDPAKLSSQDKAANNIKKLNGQLDRLIKKKSVFDIGDTFLKADKDRATAQANYDKQRADIVRSYEESLGNIRESVEQRILALRIQGIQKANEIEDQRASNELARLQASNQKLSADQASKDAFAGTRSDIAADNQKIQQAFNSLAEAELSLEQQKAKIKRDTAFEVLKQELTAERFKANIAKQVSRLNLQTARRIEDINLNIARANEVTASNRFDLEVAIAKLRLDVLEQEQKVEKQRLADFGATEAAQQVQTILDAITNARTKLDNAKPPQELNALAPVGGGGVSAAGLDSVQEKAIEQERELLRLKLENFDITDRASRSATFADLDSIRIESQNKINELVNTQTDQLEAQVRLIELQNDGLTIEQARAVQTVEALVAAQLRRLDNLKLAYETIKADTKNATVLGEVEQKLIDIAAARGKILSDGVTATENAKNLNKGLTETEQLATDIAGTLSNGITDALVLAVSGTENLGEAFQALAADILQAVGKALILAAVTKAIGAVGGGGTPGSGLLGAIFRAKGGPVDGGSPYIVGEEGPELFIPGASGSITNNDQFEAARKAMGGSNNSSSDAFADNAEAIGTSTSYTKEKVMERERIASINSNPIDVRAETTVINNVEYVTVEQFSQGMKSTARDAQAKVLSDLRNRPSTRAQVGMR